MVPLKKSMIDKMQGGSYSPKEIKALNLAPLKIADVEIHFQNSGLEQEIFDWVVDLISLCGNTLNYPQWFAAPLSVYVKERLRFVLKPKRDKKCMDEKGCDIEKEKVDLLGAYLRDGHIELYVNEIKKAVMEFDNRGSVEDLYENEHFQWLLVKVLLHEMMHAIMDVMPSKVLYDTTYGHWREESFANAGALRIIKKDDDFWKYARSFCKQQPPEYALGVEIEPLLSYDFVEAYRNEKCYGVCAFLQNAWLQCVTNNPINNAQLKSFYRIM